MIEDERGRAEVRLPADVDMWLLAPVSRNHSEELGGCVATPAELRAEYNAWLSQAAALDGGRG
jgi:hypothetical protein